jgi:hypothetical protein
MIEVICNQLTHSSQSTSIEASIETINGQPTELTSDRPEISKRKTPSNRKCAETDKNVTDPRANPDNAEPEMKETPPGITYSVKQRVSKTNASIRPSLAPSANVINRSEPQFEMQSSERISSDAGK